MPPGPHKQAEVFCILAIPPAKRPPQLESLDSLDGGQSFEGGAESFARYSVSFVFAQGGVESCLPRNLGLADLRDWSE